MSPIQSAEAGKKLLQASMNCPSSETYHAPKSIFLFLSFFPQGRGEDLPGLRGCRAAFKVQRPRKTITGKRLFLKHVLLSIRLFSKVTEKT